MALESVRSSRFLHVILMILQHFIHDQSNTSLYDASIRSRQKVKLMHTFINSYFIYLNRIDCPSCTSSTTRTTSATSNRSVTWTCAKQTSNGHQQPTHATVKKANRPSQDWKAGQKLKRLP